MALNLYPTAAFGRNRRISTTDGKAIPRIKNREVPSVGWLCYPWYFIDSLPESYGRFSRQDLTLVTDLKSKDLRGLEIKSEIKMEIRTRTTCRSSEVNL